MAKPVDIAKKLCPRARSEYLAALAAGGSLFKQHGITTPLRMAHFLAQAFHETGGLTVVRESGNYRAARIMQIFGVGRHSAAVTASEAEDLAGNGPALFERVYGAGNPKKAKELGNTEPGDGWKFRGNGILQTTGRGNHRRMGRLCGVDFEANPDLVTSPAHALKPALAEWSEGHCNDYADKDNLRAITRRINGGYNGIVNRETWFRKIRPLIDTVDIEETPAPDAPITKTAGIVVGGAVVAGAAAQQTGHVLIVASVLAVIVLVGAIGWWIKKQRETR